ncbi:MAG: macro domain-containing protein [Anaerolineae bacterium]|nr:macro domain-containing protein [Anaerolineae bacterium]
MQKLILVDPLPGVCAAWHACFHDLPGVEIVQNYFEQLPAYDCMGSAGNGFGLMDGGVDAAIVRYFGGGVMQRVQERIRDDYRGELSVGAAFIVPTDHPQHPFIAFAPTMRVPMNITGTDNVYKAMWAMLIAVHQHNRRHESPILTLACPGLGTATGNLSYREAARQMALAYRHFLQPPAALDWPTALERQAAVRYGSYESFLLPTD